MRALPFLLAAALVAPVAAAGHATYVDETKLMGCLAMAQVGSVLAALNCGVSKEAAAAEPAGGAYRLTVTWSSTASEWQELQLDLKSCKGACVQSGVCINNVCSGGGGNVVQHAQAQGTSPLSISIPTAGDEDRVLFRVLPPGPAFASVRNVQVHYVLAHA